MESDDPIEVQFTLTEKDISKVARHQLVRNTRFRIAMVVYLLLIVVVFTLGNGAWGIVGAILTFLVAFVFCLWITPRVSVRRIRQQSGFGPQTWKFSDEHVQAKLPRAESTMQWTLFDKVEELPKYFVFKLGDSFVTIPRRGFTEVQEGALRRHLNDRGLIGLDW